MKHAAFLFGSGISYASDAPTVDRITDAILTQGWYESGYLQFSPNEGESAGRAKPAQEFLRLLKGYIEPHLQLREGRKCHYEDLHAAADQIFRDEQSEIVNPMLCGSVSEIRESAANLCQDPADEGYANPFSFLVHSAVLLIHSVVFNKLWPVQNPKGLEALSSVAKTAQQTDIFSLNHDLLIERQLERNGILFSDGFSQKIGDVLRFNWSWNEGIPVRLYKLHGSLDWYPFLFPDGIRQFAKLSRSTDPHECKDDEGNYLSPQNLVPFFLTGTIGKDRLYSIGFPGEVFRQFHARLNTHRTLVCCGYGWKDTGINNFVNQWLHDSHEKRIIILHGGSLATLKGTRYWNSRWANAERNGKLLVVPKWLNDCTPADLEPFFDN